MLTTLPPSLESHALRLHPGADLHQALLEFALAHHIQAGFIITGVGSLRKASLRLAGRTESQTFNGPFEIISLSGTLSIYGEHLHVGLADGQGKTLAGRLVKGCQIATTAEIILADSLNHRFIRQPDPHTGYSELVVELRDQAETFSH
ncbi:MAG: PPC domain-containing DNA-binding protein [Cyanobacteria bacterium P01_H01_bin.15]